MHVVIELRRDVNPNVVLNQLYKHTQMQETFGVNMLVLVDNQPRILTLREVLHYYLEHQKEVVTRRTRYDLEKAEARAHILEGLRIALDHIDEVITLIRSSRTVEIARSGLMSRFGLSEKQAQAILDMRLQRLTGLERDKIEEEYNELMKLIAYYKELLADEHKIMGVVRSELLAIKEKFDDPRRTEIVADEGELSMEDLVADEDIVVTITHQGYVKRVPVSTYKSQKRGGRGVTGINTKEEDFVEHLFVTSTHDTVLFFTDQGRVYRLRGYEIPEGGRQARGTPIINLIMIESGERINAVIPIKEFDNQHYLLMVTRHGIVKKTMLSEYETNRKGGLSAISLDEGDEVIAVRLTDGDGEVVLVTEQGQAIRFSESEVRPMGRVTRGVKGITLRDSDTVVGMDPVREDADLLVITEHGFGKRTPLSEYRDQSRGGKGIKTIKVTEKNGPIVGIKVVQDDDELMIINAEGIVIRIAVRDVSRVGRDTQGVRVMRLGENDRIVAIARVVNKDEDDEGDEAEDTGKVTE
jgi:DNA gyrase subunit A